MGFDFLFIIEQFFNKDITETIQALEGRIESQVAKQVGLDPWTELKPLSDQFVPFGGAADFLEGAEITECTLKFHGTMMAFIEDLDSFFSNDVCAFFFFSFFLLFLLYF